MTVSAAVPTKKKNIILLRELLELEKLYAAQTLGLFYCG